MVVKLKGKTDVAPLTQSHHYVTIMNISKM